MSTHTSTATDVVSAAIAEGRWRIRFPRPYTAYELEAATAYDPPMIEGEVANWRAFLPGQLIGPIFAGDTHGRPWRVNLAMVTRVAADARGGGLIEAMARGEVLHGWEEPGDPIRAFRYRPRPDDLVMPNEPTVPLDGPTGFMGPARPFGAGPIGHSGGMVGPWHGAAMGRLREQVAPAVATWGPADKILDNPALPVICDWLEERGHPTRELRAYCVLRGWLL